MGKIRTDVDSSFSQNPLRNGREKMGKREIERGWAGRMRGGTQREREVGGSGGWVIEKISNDNTPYFEAYFEL